MPDKKLPVSVGSATRRAVESGEGTRTIEQRRTRRQNKQTLQGGRGEGEGERGGACRGLCGGHASGLGGASSEYRAPAIAARSTTSCRCRWQVGGGTRRAMAYLLGRRPVLVEGSAYGWRGMTWRGGGAAQQIASVGGKLVEWTVAL